MLRQRSCILDNVHAKCYYFCMLYVKVHIINDENIIIQCIYISIKGKNVMCEVPRREGLE